jgi:3-oxoadipate enol-lactonase
MWEAQRAEFAQDFRVLTPNFRCIGSTSKFEGQPTMQTMADDLVLWLDYLRIEEKIVLGGLSMGGYVALEFARSYSDRLKGLILADTRADTDTADGKKARDEMIEFARQSSGEAVAEKMLPKLLGETTRQNKPEVVSRVKEIASANVGANLANLVAALRDRRDSTPILADITVPTLVLSGREDVVSPPEVMGEMASLIPGAKHIMLDGAAHLSNLEQPEAFNAVLRNFLSELK